MGKFIKRYVSFESAGSQSVSSKDVMYAIQSKKKSLWIDKLQHSLLGCIMAGSTLLVAVSAVLAQDLADQDLADQNLAENVVGAADLKTVTFFNTLAQQTLFENSFEIQQAQTEPSEPDQPLQAEVTLDDQQVMEELISIAVRNAPAVRDARAAMGISPFIDAFVFEIAPSRLSSTLTDTSDPILAEPYRTSDNSTTTTFTFNPVQLINGIQQIPALRSHLRDAEQQTRVAVIQNYVAYVQARQTAAVSARQLNTVVDSILEESQVASAQLDQILASSILANNDSYITAATESLAANGDEMVALETLAATVGMPTQDMLTVIETTVTQAAKGELAVAVEQQLEAELSPAVLVINRDRD